MGRVPDLIGRGDDGVGESFPAFLAPHLFQLAVAIGAVEVNANTLRIGIEIAIQAVVRIIEAFTARRIGVVKNHLGLSDR